MIRPARPLLAAFLAAALLACASLALRAQTPPPAPTPTELVADKLEMSSTDTETRAVCIGHVVLTGTNLRIVCDRLELIANRLGGADDDASIPTLERFRYLLAEGNVRIVQEDREATCGRAEVFPAENRVVLTIDPVLVDHSSNVTAAGERITLLRGERQVFVDKPRFTGPPIRDLGANAPRDPATPPPPASAAPIGPAQP